MYERFYERFGVHAIDPATDNAARVERTCNRGVIRSWLAGSGLAPTTVELEPAQTLVIPPTAWASSITFQELDRVQRPVGREIEVCTSERALNRSRVITVQAPSSSRSCRSALLTASGPSPSSTKNSLRPRGAFIQRVDRYHMPKPATPNSSRLLVRRQL
jgi:hypothetical protein